MTKWLSLMTLIKRTKKKINKRVMADGEEDIDRFLYGEEGSTITYY
jgi:hypothetical protein